MIPVSPIEKKSCAVDTENKKNNTLKEDNIYKQAAKITVEKNGVYVTGVALKRNDCSTFAASTSNKEVKCFSMETAALIHTFSAHEKPISQLRYSNEDSNLIYSSSLDGNIRLWDMRTKDGPAQKYFDDSDEILKPISAFDLSVDEEYICGGTELIREDSFLVFWDRRSSRNLGGYWNSHTDDITQVRYHPYKKCVMATGSTDGLMNIFDLSQSCEEEALQYTLNTGSSVGSIMWDVAEKSEMSKSQLACITHVEELQLWNVDNPSPRMLLNRDDLQSKGKCKVDYLINTLYDSGKVYLVTGQRNGSVNIWVVEGLDVKLWCHLDSSHSDDVRTVAWNPEEKTIITGGDDGIVCIWRSTSSEVSTATYKMLSHLKQMSIKHTQKPY